MAMPSESSIFCEKCGVYNIQNHTCIIINGKAYCDSCIHEDSDLIEKLKEEVYK